jgi:uncharacterized protein YjbI with pentapeptide repeats
MAERHKRPERSRGLPRRLPDRDESNCGKEQNLLDGSPLEDLYFTDLDLTDSRISSIRGGNLVFDRVSFAGSEIASFRLFDVRFVGCDLSNTMIRTCEADRVEFIDCKLTGLNAFACRFEDVLIERCDARFVQLSEGLLRSSEIVASDFTEAVLNGVDLRNTDAEKRYVSKGRSS